MRYYQYSNDLLNVTCDFCGESCKRNFGTFEYAKISFDWGWNSSLDKHKGELQICETCFRRILDENNIDIAQFNQSEVIDELLAKEFKKRTPPY